MILFVLWGRGGFVICRRNGCNKKGFGDEKQGCYDNLGGFHKNFLGLGVMFFFTLFSYVFFLRYRGLNGVSII